MDVQDESYWICARVESVSCYGDWYYISCKKCGKKVLKDGNQFFCSGCGLFDGSGFMRYYNLNNYFNFDIFGVFFNIYKVDFYIVFNCFIGIC